MTAERVPLVQPGQHIPTTEQLHAVLVFRDRHPELFPPGTLLTGDIANYAISWYNDQEPLGETSEQ